MYTSTSLQNNQPTNHAIVCSAFAELVTSFSLFRSSHPLHDPLSPGGAGGLSAAAAAAAAHDVFPRAIAIQYHSKKHKQLLWPLKVAQEQVQ